MMRPHARVAFEVIIASVDLPFLRLCSLLRQTMPINDFDLTRRAGLGAGEHPSESQLATVAYVAMGTVGVRGCH